MKIVGIVPSTPSPYLKLGIFRLGLPILGTIARDKGHQVMILDENIKAIDLGWLKKELVQTDLIIFSSITSTYNRTLEYLDWIKKDLNLSIPTAIGGAHPSFEGEKVLDDGFDFVFRYEGELIFPEFLRVLESDEDLSKVPNLCWKKEGKKIYNPISPYLPDLDQDVPFPDFSDKNLFPQWNRKCMAVIETSRSCPYRCSFCSVHPMFKTFRQRKNLEAIVEEEKKLNPKFIFYSDDYFASYKDRERSKELMRLKLQKQDNLPLWGAQVRSDIAQDEEWLRLAKRTNCFFLCIGFESITSESLKEAHKGQTLESIERDIANFKKYRLGHTIHGSFIIGFDADDKQTALRTASWARSRMNSFQMGIVAPLPGTEFREKLKREGRLLPQAENPELCDGLHVLFTHPQMTPLELQNSIKKGGKIFSPLWDNIYLTLKGTMSWIKDWMATTKNKEMAIRSFRKPVVRWRTWNTYRKLKSQFRKYSKILRRR